jgi:hypothetical protein
VKIVRLVFAVIVFTASLLTVIPAPTYNLWKASIAVTEWGHYLAVIALLTWLPGWWRSRAGAVTISSTGRPGRSPLTQSRGSLHL